MSTSITELKQESTLGAIAESENMRANKNVFAVVIDLSEPVKPKEGSNFLLRLKVIDPSFNYKEKVNNPNLSFHKFVHVHLYLEDPKDVPKIEKVGTVIRLRRFSYKISDRGDMVAAEVKFSNWLVYSGECNAPVEHISAKKIANNKGRELSAYEAGRITNLREWISDFFYKNSLIYVTWWSNMKALGEEKGKPAKIEKVDLILKCQAFNSKEGRLSLTDRDGRMFDLVIGVRAGIKTGEFIRLRCVDVLPPKSANGPRPLALNALSSCLKVPANFCDVKLFGKTEKPSGKGGKSELPFMGEYEAPECARKGKGSLVTAVKKGSGNLPKRSVAELTKMLADPTANHGDRFLLCGNINGFASTAPADVLKRLVLDNKKVVDLKSKEAKDKRSKVIYNLVMKVSDEGSDFANVYYVSQEYGSHVFDNWKVLPALDDTEGWKNLKESKLNDFQKKLNGLLNKDSKVCMAVELAIAKNGKGFLKMVDTVFTN